MQSLYAVLFSSGHIKVGRSTDPKSRIASHADRVSCMGIELSDYRSFACDGLVAQREALLITRCAEAASERFQNEWFAGLDGPTVFGWAHAISLMPLDADLDADSFGQRLRAARNVAGMSQSELGKGLAYGGGDLNKAAVSAWEVGRNFPNVIQLRALCERLNVSADSLVLARTPA